MGLGSTKKTTKHFTAIQRLLANEDIVPSSRIGVLKYLFDKNRPLSPSINSKSLPDYLMEASRQSLPNSFNRAYNYAASGQYAYGLPTAESITTQAIDLDARVKTYLDGLVGFPVTLIYAQMGDANYQHFLWRKLITDYGYDPSTNELTGLSATVGFDCFLLTAQLTYGSYTIQSDPSNKTLSQQGLSVESGACITRPQDFNVPDVLYNIDTGSDDAYVTFQYQYLEIVPDTTPPPNVTVNVLDTLHIEGYGEKGCSVAVTVNTVPVGTVVCNSLGFFTYTFASPLVATDVVGLVASDSVLNSATGVNTTVPYTNPTPATVGTDPTVTEVLHTESVVFDFLDVIPSTVPVTPVAVGETPPVSVGSDNYVPDPDWIQASYTYNDGSMTHVGYLTYAHDSGAIPALDDLFQGTAAFGQFYPRLYFTLNNTDLLTTDKTASPYRTSKALAKKLGLDWAEVAKMLYSSVENGSDDFDLGHVQHMFLALAAPMNTTDPDIIEYLLAYWGSVFDTLGTPITTGDLTGAKTGTIIRVKDTVYQHCVTYSAVAKEILTGSSNPVGTYTSLYYSQTDLADLAGLETDPQAPLYNFAALQALHPHHVFRKQLTTTTYLEIRVYGVSSHQYFNGDGTAAFATEENVVIPLDRTAVASLTKTDKERVYGKCLHLFLNISIVIKIKFYQRGVFKVVLVIIAVLIAVFSGGSGTPISYAIITAVIKVIIITIIMQAILAIAVKLGLDPKIVAIIAVIAAIASGYVHFTGGGELVGLTAVELLQVSCLAFDLSSGLYAHELKELDKLKDVFLAESQEKVKQLETAKELLGQKPLDLSLDLLLSDVRSKVFINLGESPDEYMNRTSLNIIEAAQSYITDYVEMKMQPPTLHQQLNRVTRGTAYV